ncbi:hypothetical protein LTR37_012550 [Vermiconidia calcicola]|uniref:Uncharacterized protein n=1 Tax=Vermiconidia calcicola TaxID=1690605 RepID=A0ACC3MYT1_9PEZI|nr:hypothetical protein LTR37_012550 [Vermiconidia calcicola]
MSDQAERPAEWEGWLSSLLPFTRQPRQQTQDLKRGHDTYHNEDPSHRIDCQFSGCSRVGGYGFTQEAEMTEHMREAHGLETANNKAAVSSFSGPRMALWRDDIEVGPQEAPSSKLDPTTELDINMKARSDLAYRSTLHPPQGLADRSSLSASVFKWLNKGLEKSNDALAFTKANNSKPGMNTKAPTTDWISLGWEFEGVGLKDTSSQVYHWELLDSLEGYDDIDALLDPLSFSGVFQSFKELAFKKSFIDELFVRSNVIRLQPIREVHRRLNFTPPIAHSKMVVVLKHVGSTLQRLQEQGMCNGDLTVLVEDSERESVLQAAEIRGHDVDQLLKALEDVNPSESLINSAAAPILRSFGIKQAGRSGSGPSLDALRLLCFFLPLAVVSLVGVHCSNFTLEVPEGTTGTYHLDSLEPSLRDVCFYRRRLACLNAFVGGPVWVFGRDRQEDEMLLSISIRQFANLWGPLYAIPSSSGDVIALETEGGFLFKSSHLSLGMGTDPAETEIHWIGTGPVHKKRNSSESISCPLVASPKSRDMLPEKLVSFPRNARSSYWNACCAVYGHHDCNT